MIPITVKITVEDRSYLDKQIKAGQFASYGHSFRGLLYYYRTTKRVLEKLKYDNAIMRNKLKELGQETSLPPERGRGVSRQ